MFSCVNPSHHPPSNAANYSSNQTQYKRSYKQPSYSKDANEDDQSDRSSLFFPRITRVGVGRRGHRQSSSVSSLESIDTNQSTQTNHQDNRSINGHRGNESHSQSSLMQTRKALGSVSNNARQSSQHSERTDDGLEQEKRSKHVRKSTMSQKYTSMNNNQEESEDTTASEKQRTQHSVPPTTIHRSQNPTKKAIVIPSELLPPHFQPPYSPKLSNITEEKASDESYEGNHNHIKHDNNEEAAYFDRFQAANPSQTNDILDRVLEEGIKLKKKYKNMKLQYQQIEQQYQEYQQSNEKQLQSIKTYYENQLNELKTSFYLEQTSLKDYHQNELSQLYMKVNLLDNNCIYLTNEKNDLLIKYHSLLKEKDQWKLLASNNQMITNSPSKPDTTVSTQEMSTMTDISQHYFEEVKEKLEEVSMMKEEEQFFLQLKYDTAMVAEKMQRMIIALGGVEGIDSEGIDQIPLQTRFKHLIQLIEERNNHREDIFREQFRRQDEEKKSLQFQYDECLRQNEEQEDNWKKEKEECDKKVQYYMQVKEMMDREKKELQEQYNEAQQCINVFSEKKEQLEAMLAMLEQKIQSKEEEMKKQQMEQERMKCVAFTQTANHCEEGRNDAKPFEDKELKLIGELQTSKQQILELQDVIENIVGMKQSIEGHIMKVIQENEQLHDYIRDQKQLIEQYEAQLKEYEEILFQLQSSFLPDLSAHINRPGGYGRSPPRPSFFSGAPLFLGRTFNKQSAYDPPRRNDGNAQPMNRERSPSMTFESSSNLNEHVRPLSSLSTSPSYESERSPPYDRQKFQLLLQKFENISNNRY